MEMIEVFQTNVLEVEQATGLVKKLSYHFPLFKINFDLDDCDKILRIQGPQVEVDKIIELVTRSGYQCRALE